MGAVTGREDCHGVEHRAIVCSMSWRLGRSPRRQAEKLGSLDWQLVTTLPLVFVLVNQNFNLGSSELARAQLQ